MKTVNELAAHFSGRARMMVATAQDKTMPLPDLDTPRLCAWLMEREVAARAAVDAAIESNIRGLPGPELSETKDFFLCQRWLCAADFLSRLADSLGPAADTVRISVPHDPDLYRWTLIGLWQQFGPWWLLWLANKP